MGDFFVWFSTTQQSWGLYIAQTAQGGSYVFLLPHASELLFVIQGSICREYMLLLIVTASFFFFFFNDTPTIQCAAEYQKTV